MTLHFVIHDFRSKAFTSFNVAGHIGNFSIHTCFVCAYVQKILSVHECLHFMHHYLSEWVGGGV